VNLLRVPRERQRSAHKRDGQQSTMKLAFVFIETLEV